MLRELILRKCGLLELREIVLLKTLSRVDHFTLLGNATIETHDTQIRVCVGTCANFLEETGFRNKETTVNIMSSVKKETYLGWIWSSADLVAASFSWYFLRSRMLIRELLSSSLRLADE